jgi:hypothetical protein
MPFKNYNQDKGGLTGNERRRAVVLRSKFSQTLLCDARNISSQKGDGGSKKSFHSKLRCCIFFPIGLPGRIMFSNNWIFLVHLVVILALLYGICYLLGVYVIILPVAAVALRLLVSELKVTPKGKSIFITGCDSGTFSSVKEHTLDGCPSLRWMRNTNTTLR